MNADQTEDDIADPRAQVKGEVIDPKPAKGGIQSLERAAAILDIAARHPEGVSLAEVGAHTGLHTSTAFHLIKTLVNLGFLAQIVDTKRYRVGSRLFMLAAGALTENSLLSIGTPILERLSASTGEAAHLAVRSKQEITLIAKTAATGMLQLSDRMGATRPPHATAIGKVLVASMPVDDLERLLANLPLPKFTPNTITDQKSLRRELETTRQEGIAHDRCEFDEDVRCIAVPVHDFAGRCVAALGISGPVWRMTPDVLEQKAQSLRHAAAELSAQLGYSETK